MTAPAQRLVFGVSLSPDETRRIQRCSVEGACGMHPGPYLSNGATPKACSACRGRSICGQRRDDPARAERLQAAAAKAVAEACRAGDPCPFRLQFDACECRGDLNSTGDEEDE